MILAVLSASLVCATVAACGSDSAPSSALSGSSTASAKPVVLGSDATRSASPNASASPKASACGQPGTEIIEADGITTVDGKFAITGYAQKLLCGPGVLDDVEYENTGPHRSFVLPATVTVQLLGTTPTEQHASTLAVLEDLLSVSFGTRSPAVEPTADYGSMLWSHDFALRFGANGQIASITGMYRP